MEKVWLGKGRPWLKMPVVNPELGHTLTIRFVEGTDVETQKAPDDGVYVLGNGRFRVKKGDPMPEGAKFEKVEGSSKEKRDAQSKRGGHIYETTAGQGPTEGEQAGMQTRAAEPPRDPKKP